MIRGYQQSLCAARTIMDALDEFKLVSGLIPSLPKSTAYFCNVLNHTKLVILHILPFEESRLPVKYLGVPLVSSRLVFKDCKELIEKEANSTRLVSSLLSSCSCAFLKTHKILPFEESRLPVKYLGVPLVSSRLVFKDCKELIEKVEGCINDWKNKSLSIAGRLQLVQSVIASMHVYWASVFILPSHILLEIEQLMRVVKSFSVNAVWQALRPRGDKIMWVDVAWFPNCIPRHAFNLWLIIKRKLKMQDLLRSWDVSGNLATNCPLCDSIPDSHARLFFDYVYSKQVWNRVKDWAGLSNVAPSIDLIIDFIIPTAKRRTLKCVIAKLVVAAAAYFIWHERNCRLLKKAKRSEDQIVDCILSSVLLKLFSCRFKQSREGLDLMRGWKISESIFSLR
ncbi:reverse transcriptase domain, reverse transcriptase zinc-binding domain protein [Tanacetum coccineum]